MKELNEVQAWREIARRMERAARLGQEQAPIGVGGLCNAVTELLREGRLAYGLELQMLRRLREYFSNGRAFYWVAPCRNSCRAFPPRVIAATLLAEMARAGDPVTAKDFSVVPRA